MTLKPILLALVGPVTSWHDGDYSTSGAGWARALCCAHREPGFTATGSPLSRPADCSGPRRIPGPYPGPRACVGAPHRPGACGCCTNQRRTPAVTHSACLGRRHARIERGALGSRASRRSPLVMTLGSRHSRGHGPGHGASHGTITGGHGDQGENAAHG